MTATVYDIAIVGAGAAGLALALALKREISTPLEVAVVAPAGEPPGRLRTVALSAGSRALLERLGAWREIEPEAQPIREMAIFDASLNEPARIEQLRFDSRQEGALAHMAYVADVTKALEKAAVAAGVHRIDAAVRDITQARFAATLTLADGAELSARLVVAADGGRSKLRGLVDIPTIGWTTGQSGIVATLAHDRDHEGRAEQHFLPAGPFAMLPMRGRFSSIVWNEAHEEAERLIALDPLDFVDALERRFPAKLGAMQVVAGPRAYPLEFRFARSFIAERLALIGDAAHLVHPLAGLGLNLGLRDVAALAETLVERLRLGLDPGPREALEDYQRRRRFDTLTSGLGMDAMNRLFSNDIAPLRFARDLGLRVVDRAPPLKRRLMAEAAGQGPSPLLRGLGL